MSTRPPARTSSAAPPGWTDLEPAVGSNPPGFLERRELVNGDSWRYDIFLGWHVSSTP